MKTACVAIHHTAKVAMPLRVFWWLQEGHYGKIRLWGSAGNGVGAAIAGSLVHIAPPRNHFDPLDAFFVNAICTSLCFVPTLLLPTWALKEKLKREGKGRIVATLSEPNLQQHDAEVGTISPIVMRIPASGAAVPEKHNEAETVAPVKPIRTTRTGSARADHEPDSSLPAIDEAATMSCLSEDALLREVELHIPITTTPELQVQNPRTYYASVAIAHDIHMHYQPASARSTPVMSTGL